MSKIRVVYHPLNGSPHAPEFPATDQHPDAVRYLVGDYYVDAIGGEPTAAEIDSFLRPVAKASAGRDRERDLKRLGDVMRSLPAEQQAAMSLVLKLLKEK